MRPDVVKPDGLGSEPVGSDASGPEPRPAARVVPSWTEPVATAASTFIGGPLGRHAVVGRSWFWTPLRVVLLATVLTLAAGWLVKAPCIQQYPGPDGGLTLDWQAGRQYVAMCYSDIITLYGDHRLAGGELPYKTHWETPDEGSPTPRTHYMDYPVVTGFFLWATARLTVRYEALAAQFGLPSGLQEVLYFDITAGLLAIAWLVVVWAVRRMRPMRPWDAVLVAISPLALLHVFTGTDALAVAAVTGGMYAYARGRPGWAGALLGLATATKLYAALLFVPLMLLWWRRRRREGRAGPEPRMLAIGAGTWLAVNAPVMWFYTAGWLEFIRTGLRAAAAPDSLYFVLSYLAGWSGLDGRAGPGQAPVPLNLVVLALFVACCVGLAVLVWRAPRQPRLASLAFLIVAAALLVNKSWSPQFSLWLVPLAVLALPRWRLLLAWMTIDALIWVPRMFYYLGVENKGLPAEHFLVAVLIRDAVVVLLMVLVVRSVLAPSSRSLAEPVLEGGAQRSGG
ncbi:glycosyltransferase family 87 protein [Pseudonocardia acaciae]|uniref:glycosyltransferase family 87 protein n=1 Tax=Pseudonocardia acaciae TaxID=551276 RepID=UPI00068675D1|nr:glycosyltransferase 87 family protein [Pseudonocardia acaciae]